MTYIVAVSFVIFTPPQDVATELESPFLGAQAVEDWVPSDDDEGGAPRSPVDMPSPTPSPPSPVVAEDVAEPVEVGEETAPTEQDETPGSGSVKEHLEDGQGWWATNSTNPTPSPKEVRKDTSGLVDPNNMETLPYSPPPVIPVEPVAPDSNLAAIDARIAFLQTLGVHPGNIFFGM